ncbi:MAG TPA: TIGR03118 family protein [Bryobacteraceae bacterium]|nr:TIGR03118 family protein [Bryobacteraceae bacterium]
MLLCAVAAQAQSGANSYRVVNLVSNVAGAAAVTDPGLVDPWGFSNPGTPFWLSDHGSGLSTVYAATGVASSLVVTIPAAGGSGTGKPTGQVQNSAGAAFKLSNGGNASFIFASEDGLITAWNNAIGRVAEVKIDNSSKNAVYKGLAIGTSAAGGTLYGANFRSGKIDTWGPGFAPVTLAGSFNDSQVPSGYAPFNIWNLNSKLYVEYAKQDANQFLDVGGPGTGYVAVFDLNGNLLQHLISGGALNSPWGVAIAPAGWGAFGGALIVGNFGDGRINAFDATSGAFLGALQDTSGNPITISGLWGIVFGTGTRADVNTLYFCAGIPNGSQVARGLLGTIAPPSAVTAVANAASWQTGAIAPGEVIVIGGQTVGAVPLTSATIPATGSIATTLANVTVTINNVKAPILYTSGPETSVIVPNFAIPSSYANIVVQTPGQTTQAFSVNMAQAAPGLFASNSGGSGQLVAINQDGTINSATNAAAGGSTVMLYATGTGATSPIGVDGAVQGVAITPIQKVSLTIGGQPATIVSAGTPAGFLSGVTVIRAAVPSGLTAGAVPVVLTVGSAATTQNVTINVR